jgi:hypothetical protein
MVPGGLRHDQPGAIDLFFAAEAVAEDICTRKPKARSRLNVRNGGMGCAQDSLPKVLRDLRRIVAPARGEDTRVGQTHPDIVPPNQDAAL